MKTGCKKRYKCLENFSLVDEPGLIVPQKRQREDDHEGGLSAKKDLRLSKSPDQSGNVQTRILQFESVECGLGMSQQ